MSHKLCRFWFIIFGLFNLFFSCVYADQQELAVGRYYSSFQKLLLPLLIRTQDYGRTWQYSADITSFKKLPKDFYNYSILSSSSCNAKFCVSAGSYTNNLATGQPLIAVSKNQGESWHYINLKPRDYLNGADYAHTLTFCNEAYCMISMVYENTQQNILPFFAISEDGENWNFPKSITENLPTDGLSYLVHGLHCSDNVCAVAGLYEKWGSPRYYTPLIATSQDRGKTWTYSKLGLSQYQRTWVHDVKCHAKTCVATCSVEQNDIKQAVVLVTQDQGATWKSIFLPVKAPNITSFHATISVGKWVLAGSANTTKIGKHVYYRPFAFTSTNDGLTWDNASSVKTELPKELDAEIDLVVKDLQCHSNHCIMPLTLAGESLYHLPVVISHDFGSTWSYSSASNKEILPVHLAFYDKNSWIMTCEIEEPLHPYPCVLTSYDNGKSWLEAKITLPQDFDWGGLQVHNRNLKKLAR